MRDAPGTRDYDWWLVAILAAICALGVIEIYSATHGSALTGMHLKQMRWLVVGVVLMFVFSRVDYHVIMDQALILYIIGIAALLAVLLVGHTRFGAKRWIPILGEFFQVSELVKLIIIIVLARFFAEVRTDELSLQDLIKAGLIVGLPLVLILKQPDLGTALVLMPMLVVGAFLAGLQWKHAAAIVLIGVLMLPAGWHFLKPYQKERVTSFLHPEEDAKGSGYQVLQSKIAVGSGGFWGKGFGNGSQNQLGYIPVRYSDFIMSAWAEEQGIQRRAACFGAVHGVVVAFGAERPAGEGPRGNVSGHGRDSGAGVSRFGECGYGHRGNADNGYPFAADVLRRIGHVVCIPGDWPGDECPAAPIR